MEATQRELPDARRTHKKRRGATTSDRRPYFEKSFTGLV